MTFTVQAADAKAEIDVSAEIEPFLNAHGPGRKAIPDVALEFDKKSRKFSANTSTIFFRTNISSGIKVKLTSANELINTTYPTAARIPFNLTLAVKDSALPRALSKGQEVRFSYDELKLGTFTQRLESEYLIFTIEPDLDRYSRASAGNYEAKIEFQASPATSTF